MKTTEFESLPRSEQSKKLFYDGIHFAGRDFENFSTALYYCDGLYVEVIYDSETLANIRINCASEPLNYDYYIDQIEIR